MGQIGFTISLVLIGLFMVAIVGFALSFADNNTVYVDLEDDTEISELYTGQRGNITQFHSDTESTYESIINSTIASGDETTVSGGQFKITPVTAVAVSTNILRVGYEKIFGSGSGFGIFLTSFLALILFVMGLFIWKTWAGRNPD